MGGAHGANDEIEVELPGRSFARRPGCGGFEL
jgi:hypothetical protein